MQRIRITGSRYTTGKAYTKVHNENIHVDSLSVSYSDIFMGGTSDNPFYKEFGYEWLDSYSLNLTRPINIKHAILDIAAKSLEKSANSKMGFSDFVQLFRDLSANSGASIGDFLDITYSFNAVDFLTLSTALAAEIAKNTAERLALADMAGKSVIKGEKLFSLNLVSLLSKSFGKYPLSLYTLSDETALFKTVYSTTYSKYGMYDEYLIGVDRRRLYLDHYKWFDAISFALERVLPEFGISLDDGSFKDIVKTSLSSSAYGDEVIFYKSYSKIFEDLYGLKEELSVLVDRYKLLNSVALLKEWVGKEMTSPVNESVSIADERFLDFMTNLTAVSGYSDLTEIMHSYGRDFVSAVGLDDSTTGFSQTYANEDYFAEHYTGLSLSLG